MENRIEIFRNDEFGEVRTVTIDGNTLFCGADVAKVLGYSRPSEAVSHHARGTLKQRIPYEALKECGILPLIEAKE